MTRAIANAAIVLAGALALALLAARPVTQDTTLGAMQAELERSTRFLRLPNHAPPYYTAYWVVDYDEHTLQAVLGALVADSRSRGRRVRVEARVGSVSFDNSNFIGSGFDDFFRQAALSAPQSVPMDDPRALRHALWLATDAIYKDAIETLEKKRAARHSELETEEAVPSFTKRAPTRLAVEDEAFEGPADYRDLVKKASGVFRDYAGIQTSQAGLVVSRERRYFTSSEGSEIVVPTPYLGLVLSAQTQASDGMHLERSAAFHSLGGEPPSQTEATRAAHRVAKDLSALRQAPVIEDYSGPVLFEGLAAAQIMHELLSSALSGTPPPRGGESLESPLSRKLNKRILPRNFTVIDDPSLTELGGVPLIGHYLVDDEGVRPEKVSLVERGRLRGYLMSRTPRRGFSESNGHGRSGLVGWARGRVGNLIITVNGGLGPRALRARLLRAVREEGGEYGLVITELEQRATSTGGQAMPAPELVYRLTLDGKQELVRGATLSPMSIRDLKDILAAGRTPTVYNFAVPTPSGFAILSSVSAPSLLFEDVEASKPSRLHKRPPIVARPAPR